MAKDNVSSCKPPPNRRLQYPYTFSSTSSCTSRSLSILVVTEVLLLFATLPEVVVESRSSST